VAKRVQCGKLPQTTFKNGAFKNCVHGPASCRPSNHRLLMIDGALLVKTIKAQSLSKISVERTISRGDNDG
jgi:hypothetical protein